MKTNIEKQKAILEFIKERLKIQNKEFVFTRSQRTKDTFFRFFADEKGFTHVFTIIKDTPETIKEWYKASHFDGSMDTADKKSLLEADKIEIAVNEYFKQKFEIDGESFYFRWS